MNWSERKLIESRLDSVSIKLSDALAQNAEIGEINKLEDERKSLKAIIDNDPSLRTPLWALPIGIAAAAVFVVGLGLIIHVAPRLALDAHVTELSFTAASPSSGFGGGPPIIVTQFRVVGDARAAESAEGLKWIQGLRVLPNSHARIRATGANCFSLIVEPDVDGKMPTGPRGLQFVALIPPAAHPISRSIALSIGAELSICSANKPALIAGPITDLEISRVYNANNPRVFLPSILDGTLRIAQTAYQRTLGDRDRFSFGEISNGWLVVSPDKDLRVVFSGEASRANWVGISADDHESLAPNLVELCTASPWIKPIFGAVSGLAGILWSIKRFFGV